MSAARRLHAVTGHLTGSATAKYSQARKKILEELPDDVVITCAVRTPLTKAQKGGLKDTPAAELLVHSLKAIKAKSGIDPAVVEDVCVGTVLTPAAGFVARAAVLNAGFPVTAAAYTASRFCSSGLLAIQAVAQAIANGSIKVGIAVGCESMSSTADKAPALSDMLMQTSDSKDSFMPMGWTSENVAADFGITREMQDEFAVISHNRAEQAQEQGWAADEIVPLTTHWNDPKTGETKEVLVDSDDGVRRGTTYETLSKIRSAFPQWKPSTTTGGNASQRTDGAAAILLMKRSTAEALGQRIMGKYVQSTVVGLNPRIMGIAPALAIPKVLEQAGLVVDDIDLFEINEAFASMYVYCVKTLGLDISKVNVRGGAIAIGHPLGCTGVRQVVTALSELKRRKGKIALTSMCVGTGMGMAGIFVNEV